MSVSVITGGAGGLGQALTRRLRRDGWTVVLVDLPGPALDACAGEGVECFACDITDGAALEATCAAIAKAHPALDLVVYNAGVTLIGAFAEADLGAHRRVFEINYFGAVAMARHLLQAVRAGQGVHLAISSVAGFAPVHHRTAYAGSKHALEGFFKSLRSEEKPFGVDVLIAAPSFVSTNTGRPDMAADGLARPGSAKDGIDEMSPDDAAGEILAGYRARRPMTPVGRVARLAWRISRFLPGVYQRQMEKRITG